MVRSGNENVNSSQGRPLRWEGIFPAALTMFSKDGGLDEAATAAHIDGLIATGAAGVVAGGTSGEFIAMSPAERERVIAIAVEVADARVPVVADTGAYSTDATISLTRAAERLGASGALVILPYYQRPSLSEVVDHIRSVARSAHLPVCVYNNPTNSAAPQLPTRTVADLYREGHAWAVKSTVPTVHEIHELLNETDDGFRVFYGTFMAPLEALAGGAHGWMSGILNVALPDALDLWRAIRSSDLEAARVAWGNILPIRDLYVSRSIGEVSDLAIYRGILELRGEHGGWCRPPLRSLDNRQMAMLEAALAGMERPE